MDSGREMRGGQYQVLLLIEHLRVLGCSQRLLARAGTPLSQEARRAGIETGAASLAGLLGASGGYDILHVHDGRSHTIAAIAALAPIVVSRRVAFPIGRSVGSRWKYARARRYVAVSRFVARELISGGVREDRVEVIYDAVASVPALGPWRRTGPAIALASADPMKGRDLVERAAHISGVPVRFSDDLVRDLPEASMFVYLTRAEGLGSAALVAMAHGVPVIASSVGGLPEIVEENGTGLLVANEEASIANAMRRMVNHEGLAERLRATAHAMVSEKFTAPRLARETLAAYGRAIRG